MSRFVGTLDRYLIGKYLSTFGFALLICTIISIAIDFSDKVQTFIDKPCTLRNIVVDYYAGWIVHMAGLLMPLYTLIAVVFFTSRLAFNAEILSILNAGVSFSRLLRPYLIAGGAIALLHLTLNHFVIPRLNKSKLWFEHTFVWTDQDKGKTSNVHIMLSPNTKIYVRGYVKNSKVASGLRLQYMNGSEVRSILDAEIAVFKAEPDVWEITNYSIRTFDNEREAFRRYTGPFDTAIGLRPEDFVFFQNQNQEMTTPELREAQARELMRGQPSVKSYAIEEQRRNADAFTNIILTVIGLAIAGRKVRGGMGLHLAMAVGLGALLILLQKFVITFAASGTVPIVLGMWMPNLLFGALAIWLIGRAQK